VPDRDPLDLGLYRVRSVTRRAVPTPGARPGAPAESEEVCATLGRTTWGTAPRGPWAVDITVPPGLGEFTDRAAARLAPGRMFRPVLREVEP
jgi:hypothetical protein